MKNNKGHYSWIHSLKEAAILSYAKGQKMLNEELNPNWKPDFKAVAGALQRPGEAPVINPKHPGDASLSPEQIFDKIKQEKIARGDQRNLTRNLEGLAQDMDPNNADMDGDGDGDADEVAASAAAKTPTVSAAPATSKLPSIQSGTFPPPSAQHPPAQFPTPEAAASKVRELNEPGDAKRMKEFHMQQAIEAAKAAVESAKKAGHGPKGQKAAAEAAVEDYKKRRAAELNQEPPERSTEVVIDGQSLAMPMESVNNIINKILNENGGMSKDRVSSSRPGTTYDMETAGELALPRSIRRKIKGPPTDTNLFKTLIAIIDNPNDHDPEEVAYADNFFRTIARATNKEE